MQRRFDSILQKIAFRSGRQASFLLGVSGGVDSMSMLHLFMDCGLCANFEVAHMNFSLRGEESDADEDMVRQFCLQYGIVFHSRRVDTGAEAAARGISIEMAARDLRYSWFGSLLEGRNLDYVAVAHNLNDSVETLYLNLLRGTGLKGVSGMKVLNGRVFRPMLEFSRAEIEDYAARRGVAYRTDSTNLESEYSRNRIRNEVFPHFERINPSFLSTVSAAMRRFSEASEIISEELQRRRSSICVTEASCPLAISISRLLEGGHPEYWLFLLLEEYGFNSSQVEQIVSSLGGESGHCFHSPTHSLVRDRGLLKIYPLGEEALAECSVRIFPRTEAFDPRNAPKGVLYADAAELKLPLSFRRWKAADRFMPLGMKNFKKVSDFFSDLKLDVVEKNRQVIVTTLDGNGSEQIVCIAGLRLDERFSVKPSSLQIAEITLLQSG